MTTETDKEGNTISVTNAAYTELETGMNVRQPDGSYVPASDEIEITQNGAVARKGRHQLIFDVNINVSGTATTFFGQHSLMKSSGTNGAKSSSSAAVPVAGRSEFMGARLPWKI